MQQLQTIEFTLNNALDNTVQELQVRFNNIHIGNLFRIIGTSLWMADAALKRFASRDFVGTDEEALKKEITYTLEVLERR